MFKSRLVASLSLVCSLIALLAGCHAGDDDTPADLRPHVKFELPDRSYTTDLLFIPDGKELVLLSFMPNDDYFFTFWEIDKDKLVRRVECPIMSGKIGFLPKSQLMIASGGLGDAFATFKMGEWKHIENLRLGKVGPSVATFDTLPDEKRIILIQTASGGPPIIWDMTTKEAVSIQTNDQDNNHRSLAITPDGKKVVIGGTEPLLHFCDIETAKVEKKITSDIVVGSFNALAYSPDGKLLASECTNSNTKRSMVALWDTTTWKIIHHFDGYDAYPTRLRFTKDGKYLIAFTGVENVRGRNSVGYVYIWGVEDRKLVERMTTGKPAGKKFVLSPDEKHLVTLSSDGTVRKWDFAAIRKDFEAKLAKEKAKK